jgi:ABC-type branched-subunit amino acid transport system ATPase component
MIGVVADSVTISSLGIIGDRHWAVRDNERGGIRGAKKIGELIQALKQTGTSIVLAEQNLHFCLGLADRAVVIDKGLDVFTGSIAELNADAQIKQRYLSV